MKKTIHYFCVLTGTHGKHGACSISGWSTVGACHRTSWPRTPVGPWSCHILAVVHFTIDCVNSAVATVVTVKATVTGRRWVAFARSSSLTDITRTTASAPLTPWSPRTVYCQTQHTSITRRPICALPQYASLETNGRGQCSHVPCVRYDTRCYFNVHSKADISQLNLPHGTDN